MERFDWRWLGVPFLGSSVRAWMLAVGISAVAYLVLLLAKRLIIRRLGATAAATPSEVDDLILEMTRRTRRWLLLVPVLFFGSLFLTLPHRAGSVLRSAAVLAVLLQLALWALFGINAWVASTRRKRLAADAASATLIGALGFLGKLVLVTLLVLVALDNLGVNVTALVAGLGIGGVALALALQNILGDLLASLSIVLDKPFVLGDRIQVDDFVGTVEDIGLKTTHLRSLSGEQIVFPNGNLLQSRIRNYKRMAERRVVLAFGVVYDTPVAALEKIPGMVREIVEAQEGIRFERAHFKKLGESSLEFDVVFTVLDSNENLYLDGQQAINLALLRRFQDEGIVLAYPTQTVRLEGPPRAPDKETPCAD